MSKTEDMEQKFAALLLADPLADPLDAYAGAGFRLAKGSNASRNAYRMIDRLGLAERLKKAREGATAELYDKCMVSRADVVHSTHDIAVIAQGEIYRTDPKTGETKYNSAAARDALAALRQIADLMGYAAPQQVDGAITIQLAPQIDKYGV